MNIHFTDPRPGEMEMMAEAGIRWVRMDFIWRHVERERGKYDFAAYDRLLAAMEKHRIRGLWILDDTNPLYDDGKFPYTDEGRAAFVRFAAAGVRHFQGHGILWEMWNEPNDYSRPNPKADVYTKLALAVGEAIHKAAPKESYVGPATSLIDMAFLEECFKAGLLRYWSGITVHPYRFKGPETVGPEYENLRALIAKYAPKGKAIPVLSGEWGWASVYSKNLVSWLTDGMNDEVQGQLLARQWLINFASGIPLSIWYDWHDDGPSPTDPEAHCGIVQHPYHEGASPVYTPKPAYFAVRTITRVLGDYRFDNWLKPAEPGDYVLVFRKGAKTRFAAWTAAGSPHSISIPVPKGPCALITHKGDNGGTLTPAAGSVSLTLTDAPQYLVCGERESSK
ncbi:MAG: beta-galactosidase [Acidobacteriota bacterium]